MSNNNENIPLAACKVALKYVDDAVKDILVHIIDNDGKYPDGLTFNILYEGIIKPILDARQAAPVQEHGPLDRIYMVIFTNPMYQRLPE
jgi:hypothetical protein